MKAWNHPELGPIRPLLETDQPRKVWKHLYAEEEHWERLCGDDISLLRSRAEAIVGSLRSRETELPWLSKGLWPKARRLLLQHHSEYYAPVYLSELGSVGTVWTPGMDDRFRHFAVTPRGVFVVVELQQPISFVVTAFRPHPDTKNVSWSEDEIERYAFEYFTRETGVKVDGLASMVLENLDRSTRVPDSVNGVWWLASAVGYGRLLRSNEEIAVALLPAEKLLEATPMPLRDELNNALNWDGLSSRLANALKDSRPEDLESVLADAEDLLAVADALGPDEACKGFLRELEMLIPWIPVEWGHIGDKARLRIDAFASESAPVLRMWYMVEDAALSASIRESEPVARPASTIADSLFPESPWQKIRDAIAELGTRSIESLGPVMSWIEESIANVDTKPPDLILSGEEKIEYRVLGYAAPNAPHHRVFLIDDDCLEIENVTSKFNRVHGYLWRFTSTGESATLVIFAGQSPILGESIEEVICEAEKRSDVVVRTHEVHPTQTTKP